MSYRLGVSLAGAVLAVGGLVVAGGMGSAVASPGTLLTTPTPSPTPTVACPPALPITGMVSAVTATSVTISYSMLLSPPCGYDPPIIVTLFASRSDAQQWLDPVAEAVSGPERNGTVTIDGLTPDTTYWYRFSASDTRDPYLISPVQTAPLSSCAATFVIDNRWSGGFAATVSVRNTGTEALDGWRVSWRWPGDQRIGALWNGVAESSGADVTVRNASYNASLAAGGATSFGMLVWGGTAPGGITLTCTR
jgi:chitodextrinase